MGLTERSIMKIIKRAGIATGGTLLVIVSAATMVVMRNRHYLKQAERRATAREVPNAPREEKAP
jgi:hypothetical protein